MAAAEVITPPGCVLSSHSLFILLSHLRNTPLQPGLCRVYIQLHMHPLSVASYSDSPYLINCYNPHQETSPISARTDQITSPTPPPHLPSVG